ncbi:hypothetical protein [Bradyrhizobium sp. Arg816]|uniref:hypothetical protein n=1 Tax=Bradyrhizobium sp. Arg816 TaxID=2998491 RepID=UPI00249F7225|nr:hypothetical protein [Bradyrhizobium sp. Arg816]MDI3563991.1 hypothetical protein [Bradyrhizobium sp. Arg816]
MDRLQEVATNKAIAIIAIMFDGFEIRVFLNDAEQIEYTAANPEEGWVRVIPPGNSLSARSILKGFVEIRIKRTSRS